MTDKLILKKDHLVPLLRRLMKERRLVAPLKNLHGDTLFTPVTDLDRVEIDLDNQAQNTIKSFLLPQQETLYHYQAGQGLYRFEQQSAGSPTLYFGLRSCDLSAVLYADVIFLSRHKDPFYLQRRRGAVFITIGCNQPFPNCFCYGTKSGPFLDMGFDLQLTDLGDRFYVQPGRAYGERIVESYRPFFSAASNDDTNRQYQHLLEARSSFAQHVHVDQVVKKLAAGEVENELWAELSGRCQDCGGCAYVCPTCTCFNVVDRPTDDASGERLRLWDACTFSGFTRMAGGHNPVNKSRHGVRKRFQHKFQHDVEKHKRPSCVGCGRCVGMCFGGVDAVSFLKMAYETAVRREE